MAEFRRSRGLLAVLVSLAIFSIAGSFSEAEEPQARRTRFLVLDSRIIEKTTGARLAPGEVEKSEHNPLFTQDKPWEPRFDNVYATVVHDAKDNLYKCLYNPFIVDLVVTGTPEDKRNPADTDYMNTVPNDRELGLCYAYSSDGINWTKPNLGIINFEGSTANNIVLRSYGQDEGGDPHGCAVLLDERDPDASRRWKINFQYRDDKMGYSFSPDGLHWSRMTPSNIEQNGTHNSVLWASELNKYVTFTRRDEEDERGIVRTESSDFETWSEPELVMKGPDLAHQTHDMMVFHHDGVYIGLLGAMIGDPTDGGDVKQHVELAWSPDSRKWHRIAEGTPLIPNSPGTSPPVFGKMPYDWGVIFPSPPIIEDDRILIFYGACDWYFFDWRTGYLALATLRPDGWAGYEPTSKNNPATIETKPLACQGEALCITADVWDEGAVRVEVLDENGRPLASSEPIINTATDRQVKWTDGWDWASTNGKKIRLEFALTKAKLYSFCTK